MVRIESRRVAMSAALGALGVLTVVTLTSMPVASADPAPLTPDPSQPVPVQQLSADPAPAPAAVPHLPSPDNLPPGTTDDPTGPPQGHGLSYLRELWHAVQTQDVSGGDALLLLTQRPMDANATPPAGMSTGPQSAAPADATAPLPPADAVLPVPTAPAAEAVPAPSL